LSEPSFLCKNKRRKVDDDFNKKDKKGHNTPLLENRAFVPGTIFHLYRVFLPPAQMMAFVPFEATNRYKCPLTEAHRGLNQPT
jgi:hypothetical protein